MKKYNLAVTIFACMLAANAHAGGASPFYLGGSIGNANVDLDSGQFDNLGECSKASSVNESCTIGDGGTAGHIYGGFRLGENLAIEAGYADLGTTAAYHYTDPVTLNQDTRGLTLSGVYRHRLGRTSPVLVYGKAGVYAWESEVNSKGYHPTLLPEVVTVEDSGVSPLIGAGLEYELNHNVSVRAGWDRYMDVGDNNTLIEVDDSGNSQLHTLETDVDVYSAGVNFSFY